MVILRLTRKLLARVGPPTPDPPASTTVLGDWFGHLVFVGHQRYVILVSERSRLAVLLPGCGSQASHPSLPRGSARCFVLW